MNPDPDEPVRNARPVVIGLAGGIASGKSTVAAILEELGAKVIDSDALVHEELDDPQVIATYRQWWGERMCTADGAIDRGAVARIIFQDRCERERMERFLYPRLECRRQALMKEYQADPTVRAIVVNAPLLYEVGLDKTCDVVVFVDSDRSTRQARAVRTRGWTPEEFERREKIQESLDRKRQMADYTVANNSGADALRSQVTTLFERLLADRSQQQQAD